MPILPPSNNLFYNCLTETFISLNQNNTHMRKFYLMLCMLVLCGQILAQNKTITGKITDPTGKPIGGASILIKGSRLGTSSQSDGTFSLSVPEKSKALTISAIGWSAQEVEIGNRTSLTISMVAKENTLSEVVVTSLGIVRDKRSLGYATQKLNGDQLADKGNVNLIGALEGKAAGVNITA